VVEDAPQRLWTGVAAIPERYVARRELGAAEPLGATAVRQFEAGVATMGVAAMAAATMPPASTALHELRGGNAGPPSGNAVVARTTPVASVCMLWRPTACCPPP